MNGCRTDTGIIEQTIAFSFLRLDNVFWEINLVEMENGFYFAFECVFILSSPTPLTQGEKEDLFEIVVLMIKAINRI